jgi:hypothetical protein
MKTSRWFGVALCLAVLALGCDFDDPPEEPVVVVDETPVGGGPGMDAPPETTISAGGNSAPMAVGSYCWAVLCVDKIGPITRATLQVASGDTVSIVVPPGTPRLNEVSVAAFPAGQSQDVGGGETAWRPDFDRAARLDASIAGSLIEFTADLPAGTYVLTAGMFFAGRDAQYGVVLQVR